MLCRRFSGTLEISFPGDSVHQGQDVVRLEAGVELVEFKFVGVEKETSQVSKWRSSI